jgi:hypothetical protein
MNAILNEYRSFFPGDAVFAYGTPEKSVTGKGGDRLALYALKTKGLSAPKLDGGVSQKLLAVTINTTK